MLAGFAWEVLLLVKFMLVIIFGSWLLEDGYKSFCLTCVAIGRFESATC